MQEAWVPSLGQEDPLKEGMATHSSILAWRIPWTEEPNRVHPWGRTELDTTYQLTNNHQIMDTQSQCSHGLFSKLHFLTLEVRQDLITI